VAGRDRLVDFSGFHTALLWAGPTLLAAGEFRTLFPQRPLMTSLILRAAHAVPESPAQAAHWCGSLLAQSHGQG
jgi:hypothetical protein